MSPVAYRSRSLDEFVPLLPSGLFKRLSSTDEGWVEICGDFHAYLAACRASEPRMIVEMMLAWPEARDDLFRQIPREEIFYVQVYCELAELERRELGREDRRAGLARSQFDRVYAFDGYDARIDSTRISPDMCAEKLANLIQSRS